MKKSYEKPFAELIEFDYSNQVVVASNDTSRSVNIGQVSAGTCASWKEQQLG